MVVVPYSIQQGGSELPTSASGEEVGEQLARRMRSEGWPVVQAPSVEQFTAVYRSLRDSCDGILSIHSSSRLSDSFANAGQAREAFGLSGHGGPFPIAVVDSQSISMGLGWLVLAVCLQAESGADLQKLAGNAVRLAGAAHFAFYTESIQGLLRTKRTPRLTSQGEGLSSSRPLMHLDEGQVAVYERTRTRPKARDALYNFVEDFSKIGEIAVIHTGALVDIEHLLTRIGAIYPREQIMVLHAGPTVTAWLGPDALGVAVLEDEL